MPNLTLEGLSTAFEALMNVYIYVTLITHALLLSTHIITLCIQFHLLAAHVRNKDHSNYQNTKVSHYVVKY